MERGREGEKTRDRERATHLSLAAQLVAEGLEADGDVPLSRLRHHVATALRKKADSRAKEDEDRL